MLEMSNKEFKVKGYYNKWYVIDEYKEWALLENATWGDETCYLVVRKDAPIMRKFSSDTTFSGKMVGYYDEIQEVVCETYDDIETALKDEGLI